MKYCPYCGASLLGSAVFFCSECGKPIPIVPQTQEEVSDPDTTVSSEPGLKNAQKQKTGPLKHGKKERHLHPLKKEKPRKQQIEDDDGRPEPLEDGYDGYYDDVRPSDNGHEKERMDPELVKRVCLVAGGAVLIIGLAIVMMLLL